MLPVIAIADLGITRETIVQHAQDLPAAPQVLGGLCEMLEDINMDLAQVAEQIRVDPALAARVLRLSNSIVFGGGSTIGSIDDAVNRIGFAEITRLVGTATVAGLVDRSLNAYGIPAERLRESLLLHALAAEALASYTTLNPRMAYAAALLRGVGMMVLDRVARGRIDVPDTFDGERFETFSAWEEIRFGITSTEVASVILESWRFPAELVEAVEMHLDPLVHDRPRQYAAVLNLAGGIVTAQGWGLAGEVGAWVVTSAKLDAAALSDTQLYAANETARSTFEQHRGALY